MCHYSFIITSAQRYIRPLIHRTYPHVVFQQLQAAVGLMCTVGRTHFIEKKVVYPTYVGRLHSFLKLVALFCRSYMHNFSYRYVGCTTLVGRMHALVGRMHIFSGSDSQLL